MTTTKEKPTTPPPPPWAMAEPEDKYHARSKSGEVMSSGMLKLFRDCPFAYWQRVNGQTADKDSAAYRFGRAVHKIVLEGIPVFNRAFAVGGPINEKTGKCYGVGTKAHDEWLAANGHSRDKVITDEEADALVAMANMTARHPQASAYLDYGWPELVARAELHGVPCQIRMDWLTHDAGGNWVIVDLKTCNDLTWFEYDARNYQYLHQFAFYRDVCQAVLGARVAVAVIAVEKKEPNRVGFWNIPGEVLDLPAAENREALAKYRQCRESDTWPTGYEEPRVFSLQKGA